MDKEITYIPPFDQYFDLTGNLFEDNENTKKEAKEDEQIKLAMLKIKHKYGKNAILKGMNLQERATTIERNRQIGGHHE